MTVENFYLDSANSQVVVEIDNTTQPTTVDITLPDGTIINRTTPDSVSGTIYTYIETLTEENSDGVFRVVVNAGLQDEIESVISSLGIGATCLLVKTLKEEWDCLLLQEMYAVETYVFDDVYAEAATIYDRVKSKCVSCVIGETPTIINHRIFVISGNKIRL